MFHSNQFFIGTSTNHLVRLISCLPFCIPASCSKCKSAISWQGEAQLGAHATCSTTHHKPGPHLRFPPEAGPPGDRLGPASAGPANASTDGGEALGDFHGKKDSSLSTTSQHCLCSEGCSADRTAAPAAPEGTAAARNQPPRAAACARGGPREVTAVTREWCERYKGVGRAR